MSSQGVAYLEVVTRDVEKTCAYYEAIWKSRGGISFGEEAVEEMGMARTATCADGTLVGVRAPLAEHDAPIVRCYVAVDDIEAAAKAAEDHGGMIAYPPTRQGGYGTFAIVILDGVQHGLWQKSTVS